MDKLYVCDTNVLLDMDSPELLCNNNIVILSHVVRELEKHKLSKNGELAFQARKATRLIDEYRQSLTFDFKDYVVTYDQEADNQYVDNKIIQCCIDNSYGLITNDLLLRLKADGYGIQLKDTDIKNDDTYSGFKLVNMTNDEYTDFYKNDLDTNKFELLDNQYLVIEDDITGELLDALRFDGDYHISIRSKGFNTKAFGSFKPFDLYQSCALDSLYNNQMTMIKGKAGSGKSLIALNFAMQQIERGKFDKLICFVNPVAARNSAKLGYYPGSRTDKLMDSSIGSMLGSKFGDKIQVERMINQEQLVLLPFSDIRGFDTTGMNAISYIIEAQNLNKDLMKLAIQRIGDDGKLIIDGDYNTQVDSPFYEGTNNGMKRVSEVFRGQNYYGEIELQKIYRSVIAERAEFM